jgi:GH15 family glucan-1,4-alpha-glucosidase
LDRLDGRSWQAAEIAAAAVQRNWQRADAGIWELDDRRWTHSRLVCAAGLRAIGAVAPADCAGRTEWVALADHIVADAASEALHADGYWQRAPDDPAVDASLLFAGLRGAVPPGDPRTSATLAESLRELTVDGYAYRFRHDSRPLHEAE